MRCTVGRIVSGSNGAGKSASAMTSACGSSRNTPAPSTATGSNVSTVFTRDGRKMPPCDTSTGPATPGMVTRWRFRSCSRCARASSRAPASRTDTPGDRNGPRSIASASAASFTTARASASTSCGGANATGTADARGSGSRVAASSRRASSRRASSRWASSRSAASWSGVIVPCPTAPAALLPSYPPPLCAAPPRARAPAPPRARARLPRPGAVPGAVARRTARLR